VTRGTETPMKTHTGSAPGARHPWRRAAIAVPALLLLAACSGGDMSDLESYVEEVKARKSQRIEPRPEIRVPELFSYQVQDRVDPFRPFVEEAREDVASTAGKGVAPPANHVREELEQFPLDTLRMVGTLEKDAQNWGLVTAPDGAVHRIQPGNYVGKNYGKITLVAEDRIELVEIVPDGLGGWQERSARLDLSE
jgi:type IV pilus assembly protein PilP